MPTADLIRQRLARQQMTSSACRTPAEVVSWLGGMQAQDYEHSKWAIGLRLPDSTVQLVDQAIADRNILRSWIMRGTLHWAAADDLHWMLDLLAPRLLAGSAGRHRQLGLEPADFRRSRSILENALSGRAPLTRKEVAEEYQRAGLDTSGQRLYHLLQRAGLEKIICFGPKQGTQFTFTLLEHSAATKPPLPREEAVRELTKRYFQSRSPATLEDFVWWSGLTKTEARLGLELNAKELSSIEYQGATYWSDAPVETLTTFGGALFLPAFDEYLVAYRNREHALAPGQQKSVISSNGIFYPVILADGKVAGTWKRTFRGPRAIIETTALGKLPELEEAAASFASFWEKTPELS